MSVVGGKMGSLATRTIEPAMRCLIVKCHDCGTEIQRSNPVPKCDELMVMLSAPLVTKRCPNGCRSTYSDLNANTDNEWAPA